MKWYQILIGVVLVAAYLVYINRGLLGLTKTKENTNERNVSGITVVKDNINFTI